MKRVFFKIIKVLVYLFLFSAIGCSAVGNYKALMALKKYGDGQEEIENYVNGQEELFHKLKQDLENNSLEKGIKREEVTSNYGEPIISKPFGDANDPKEILLYRHPTKYFSTDKIYLYFDKQGLLYLWELERASK